MDRPGRTRRRGRDPRLPSEGSPHEQGRGEDAARWSRLAAVIKALWTGLEVARPRIDGSMRNGPGRTRRRARHPRLPSQGSPHAQFPEATRRARLTAVIEALRAGLQGLRRVLCSLFARRQRSDVELPDAEKTERVEVDLPDAEKKGVPLGSWRQARQRQGGGLSVLYGGNKPPPRRKQEIRQPPPPPPSPLLMVKGKSVPKDLEEQYNEYCRIRERVPVSSTLCHLCFFEMPRHDHLTVLNGEMLKHCYDMHHGVSRGCEVSSCKVRVRTERDYELHMHFCHPNVPF